MTSTEMPRYKSHKEVWALEIADIQADPVEISDPNCESDGCEAGATITPADMRYASFHVGPDYLRRHHPHVGGYFVVYEDGYQSFSPKKAFENGYSRIA